MAELEIDIPFTRAREFMLIHVEPIVAEAMRTVLTDHRLTVVETF